MRVGIIGLGEAGAIYASAIASLHEAIGYDPVAPTTPSDVIRLDSGEEVAASSDLVIVLTGAAFSEQIAAQLAPRLRAGAVYADFTTASPDVMARVAERVEAHGARFADVAILGPVPLKGAATETIVSGSGAEDATALLEQLGATVEQAGTVPGDATARKLLRSVLMKSLQTVVVEAMEAGRRAGLEGWVHDQIAAQLSGDGAAKIARYEEGSRKHAVRRGHEMQSVVDYLATLGAPSEMSDASRRVLERLAAEG